MSKFNSTLFCLLIVNAFTACEAKKAVLPDSAPITGAELKTFEFPQEGIQLFNNKLFLWKSSMNPSDVRKASEISREIDQVDRDSLPINQNLTGLREQSKEADQLAQEALQESRKKIAIARTERTQLDRKRKAELRKPIDKQDANLIVQLEAQIAEKDKLLEGYSNRTKELASKSSALKDQIDSLETSRNNLQERGRVAVTEITNLVHWFPKQPSLVSFQKRADETWEADIKDWDLNDGKGPRSFSSDSRLTPTTRIESISYEAVGGLLNFKAVVYADEKDDFADAPSSNVIKTYCFKLSRFKYDEIEKGSTKIYYTGDLYLEKGATGCDPEVLKTSPTMRKGLAKLVSSNN